MTDRRAAGPASRFCLPAMVHRLKALLAGLSLAAAVAAAAPANPAALSAGDTEMVKRLEAYLSGVRTLESEFVQSSSEGGVARGRLYLRRPRGLRLDYEPPATLQVFADGFWLIYVDTELGEASQVPLSLTPAAFLVGETVSLSGKVAVTGVERADRLIRVEVVQSDEPEAGSVILTFGRDPFVLKGWTVVDAQGVRTRIGLVRPRFNGPIDRSVFRFDRDKYVKPDSDR